jgi:hypothetical protein
VVEAIGVDSEAARAVGAVVLPLLAAVVAADSSPPPAPPSPPLGVPPPAWAALALDEVIAAGVVAERWQLLRLVERGEKRVMERRQADERAAARFAAAKLGSMHSVWALGVGSFVC